MRSLRLAVAFAAVVSLGAGAAADAAPKPSCNLLTDPAGDVLIRPPAGPPAPYADSSLDIRSADVVSDAEGLGVTLRVAALAGPEATHTDLGLLDMDYKVFVTLESAGREVVFHAIGPGDNAQGMVRSRLGPQWRFELGHYTNDATYSYAQEHFGYYGAARGAVDAATAEIRMAVSWADLKKYGYPRARRDRAVRIRAVARDFWLSSNYGDTVIDPGGVRYHGAPRDEAATNAAYVLGARSCAKKA